jgi:uncharacterized protein YndB with AHSA1/START domain
MTVEAANTEAMNDTSVRRTVSVRASAERAFHVFIEEFDSWWPRTHHIGKVAMKKGIIEGRLHGRCYTEQVDGSECDWGKILAWDPPHRFVMAWLIDPAWQFQPDAAKASEVEVRFTPQADGTTRVDLEHRHFERLGEGANNMRMAVGSEGGWGGILALFARRVEKEAAQ